MTEKLSAQVLRPTSDKVEKAAMKLLTQRVDEKDARRFLKEAANNESAGVIGATASLDLAIYGKLKCEPDGQPFKYDITVWGGPVYFGTAIGFMYTAYESWDAFFRNVTGAHVQGIASGGGILQINWFAGALPVGQFNGASGGIGLVEAGGDGKWQRK